MIRIIISVALDFFQGDMNTVLPFTVSPEDGDDGNANG